MEKNPRTPNKESRLEKLCPFVDFCSKNGCRDCYECGDYEECKTYQVFKTKYHGKIEDGPHA